MNKLTLFGASGDLHNPGLRISYVHSRALRGVEGGPLRCDFSLSPGESRHSALLHGRVSRAFSSGREGELIPGGLRAAGLGHRASWDLLPPPCPFPNEPLPECHMKFW